MAEEYIGMHVEYEEGKLLLQDHRCAVCERGLILAYGGAWDYKGYLLRCGTDGTHRGIVKQPSLTAAYRQGEPVPLPIANRIEDKRLLLWGHEGGLALELLKARFPSADLDDPSAALFIHDCQRLDLDPFLGEVVPAAFKNKQTQRKIVQMIITEQGWLSLAARGAPERWAGAPATEPVLDPILKEAICNDPAASVWKAWGKIRLVDGNVVETAPTYGWFTQKERKQAEERNTPSGALPGNQARVRAVKRWVWTNFADAKAKVRAMREEWLRRPEIDTVRHVIEAEFAVVEDTAYPPRGDMMEACTAPRILKKEFFID